MILEPYPMPAMVDTSGPTWFHYSQLRLRVLVSSLKTAFGVSILPKLSGKHFGPFIERQLAALYDMGLHDIEGGGTVLFDRREGQDWRVRSLGKTSVQLADSRWFGACREHRYNKEEFRDQLKCPGNGGFFVYDALKFPSMPFWVVTAQNVLDLLDDEEINERGRIARGKFLKMVKV